MVARTACLLLVRFRFNGQSGQVPNLKRVEVATQKPDERPTAPMYSEPENDLEMEAWVDEHEIMTPARVSIHSTREEPRCCRHRNEPRSKNPGHWGASVYLRL